MSMGEERKGERVRKKTDTEIGKMDHFKVTFSSSFPNIDLPHSTAHLNSSAVTQIASMRTLPPVMKPSAHPAHHTPRK